MFQVNRDLHSSMSMKDWPIARPMPNNTQPTMSSGTGNNEQSLPKDLLKDVCYHGFIIQRDVEMNVTKPGHYAVWAEEKENAFQFNLAVRVSAEKVKHYRFASAIRGGLLVWSIEGMVKPANKWCERIPELLKQRNGANETDQSRQKRPDEFIRQGDVKLKQKPRLGEGNFCIVLLGTMLQKNGTSRLVALKAFKELIPESKEPADRPTFKSIANSVLDILKSDRFPLPPPNQRTLLNRPGVHERKADKLEVNLKTRTPRHRRQLFSGRDDSIDETTNERRTASKAKTGQKSMGARGAKKTHKRSTADRTQTTKTKKVDNRGVSRKTLKD
ncbi:hypothetical protein M3Y96_00009300 [Aphelenchoides besseyi]|nr:hypothetical protein M3Y96_00009300 [Aphelenchoides besseyi]